MPISYSTHLEPLYASNVVTDASYSAIVAEKRNSDAEQLILLMIEIMRAYMAEINDNDEARAFHYALNRMIAGVAYSGYTASPRSQVVGNVFNVNISASNGDTVEVMSTVVTLANGPFTNMAALVTEINRQTSSLTAEAFNDNGYLGFRSKTANAASNFVLGNGTGSSLLAKSGITPGTYYNPIERIANSARDDALSRYVSHGTSTDID